MRGWILLGSFGLMTACFNIEIDNASEILEGVASTVAESAGGLTGAHKSARAECASNVSAIKTAVMAYDAAFDDFLEIPAHPGTLPGKTPVTWDYDAEGFSMLGWAPDGQVRGQYSVVTKAPSSTASGGDFTVFGRCDVDGDGVPAVYTATKSINVVLTTPENVY